MYMYMTKVKDVTIRIDLTQNVQINPQNFDKLYGELCTYNVPVEFNICKLRNDIRQISMLVVPLVSG